VRLNSSDLFWLTDDPMARRQGQFVGHIPVMVSAARPYVHPIEGKGFRRSSTASATRDTSYTPLTAANREVVPERKLSFTWELPGASEPISLATILLEAFDGGTVVPLIREHLPNEAERESHEQGWRGWHDKLPVFHGDRE
jgi:hypothetical protein